MTKGKLLIVDDSALVLEIYKAVLEEAGFEVIAHKSPFGTSSVIATEKPNLVLVDIFMPALSGDRLVELIRKDKGILNTKVLLFSDRPEDELKSASISCGADGFIKKTKNHAEFIRKVSSFIYD